MKDKRTLALACVLLLIAAGLVFSASRMTWMSVTVTDGLTTPRTIELTGSTWAVSLVPVTLVLLAAIAAAVAVTGWARAALAIVVAVSALVVAFPAVGILGSEPDVAYIERVAKLSARDFVGQANAAAVGPVLALVGALAAIIAAVLVIRGVRARGMDSKYVSPAARRAELEKRVFDQAAAAQASERDLWDALDSGDDPTEGVRTESRDDES